MLVFTLIEGLSFLIQALAKSLTFPFVGTIQKLEPAKIPKSWHLFLIIIIILMGETALPQTLLLWYALNDLMLLDPPRREGQQGAPTEHPSTTCLPPTCSPMCGEQCSAQPGAVGLLVGLDLVGFFSLLSP